MLSIDHHALELLAPAKNADYGIEAIKHGADAVYIGAPSFGARAAVGNSIDDISRLIDYAHLFGAKVYVALNTILRDEEIPQALSIIHDLYAIGADALIIQDMGLLECDLPPIPLHSSTQMDNVTTDKVRFLSSLGFEQVVLARELSPNQTKKIHRTVPNIRIESFIHGALCVSYSGRCYAASAFHGRSANRGTCSQVCRLPYDLVDGKGQVLCKDKHLLSIKDLNRSSLIPDLIAAGVSAFKIEGRLKDLAYVKTVTAYYHQLLEQFISEHPEYYRRSRGIVELNFDPDISRTFNRGFTTLRHGARRSDDVAAFDTPKSMGPVIGTVNSSRDRQLSINLKSGIRLSNGDGLSYYLPQGGTTGIRVNTVNEGEVKVHKRIPRLPKGAILYRSYDAEYERIISQNTAVRFLPIQMKLSYDRGELHLYACTTSSPCIEAKSTLMIELEPARGGDQTQSISSVLSKLGDSIYKLNNLDIAGDCQHLFIPRSLLADLRRSLTLSLDQRLRQAALADRVEPRKASDMDGYLLGREIDYTANVYNDKAKSFYESRSAIVTQMAYEYAHTSKQAVMYTKHCIRYSLGQCPHLQNYLGAFNEPWRIVSSGRDVDMTIEFDCQSCMMKLYPTE